MSLTSTHEILIDLRASVVRTLAYFDLFDHPLRFEEIIRFSAETDFDTADLESILRVLVEEDVLEEVAGYWSLGDVRRKVTRRLEAEARAVARMPKALTMSRRIARFPFVRAVFISGSMSKGCLAPDGDIDFFVITKPGRLWVARTLLILYKKIFLMNSRKDFCVNYFLDTEHLTVEDRNRFTATEVVTLIPTYGNGTTEAFFERNMWAFSMYPKAALPKRREVRIGRAKAKKLVESALLGWLGDTLDSWCMMLTWRRWRRKFSDLDPRTFELALRTRTYVSKHHPRNFQQHVLDGFEKRITALEERHGLHLH